MKLLFLLIGILLGSISLGDGSYIPKVVSNEPAIPHQRAILRFKDGEETLIVESALKAPRGDYAWVVPVPSEPLSIESASSGTIKTLESVVQPLVWQPDNTLTGCLLVVLVSFSLFMFAGAFSNNPKRKSVSRTYLSSAFASLLIGAIAAVLSPVFAGPVMKATVGADWGRIGSFDVHTLNAEQLRSWATKQELQFSEEKLKAIQSYERDNWRFATMVFSKDQTENVAPQPLKIVFKTPRPIYPMALTFAMGHPLTLDLFVIADGEASCPEMRWWGSTIASRTAEPRQHLFDGWTGPAVNWKPTSHPGIVPLLWQGCTVSRLHGDFAARKGGSDFLMSIGRPLEAQNIVFDRGDKWWFLMVAGILLVTTLLTVTAHQKILEHNSTGSFGSRRAYAIATAAVSLTCIFLYSRLDFVEAQKSHVLQNFSKLRHLQVEATALTKSEFLTELENYAKERHTPLPPNIDAPLGMTVERTGSSVKLTAYDLRGNPSWYEWRDKKDGGQATSPAK